MAPKSGPAEQAGVDWRRLASDRNVAPDIARGLWERANAAAPDDPQRSGRVFERMLDEAVAANVTPEPGRETLVDAKGVDDPSSLGPGKLTRVLQEQKEAGGQPAGQASPSDLRTELASAVAAGKNAVKVLATSDAATIVQALKELRDTEGPGLLQKLMSSAGRSIERVLDARGAAQDPAAAPPPGAGPSKT